MGNDHSLPTAHNMFNQWLKSLIEDSDTTTSQHDLEQLAAQLLLEVARCDEGISDAERATVQQLIVERAGLSKSEAAVLLSESENAVNTTVSFHEHVRMINESCDREQKNRLIKHLWQVAAADGVIDAHEEAFVRNIANLIHVKHRDFIQTKHQVLGD